MIEALYIHFPFCKEKCDYCAFFSFDLQRLACSHSRENKRADEDRYIWSYIDFLTRQLKELGSSGLLDELKTIYVGGGTPSLMKSEEIKRLFKPLCGLAFSEATFEANPESLTKEKLSALRDAGVTRISLGVQSMNDGELKSVGRLSSSAKGKKALRLLDETNFEISADVMVGLPNQTKESLEKTLTSILQHRVSHVSAYPLSVEESTRLSKRIAEGSIPCIDEDEEACLMEVADGLLTELGLAHYEISNYAFSGHEAKHNLAYWEGKEYMALGFAGASMVKKETYNRIASIFPCLPQVSCGTVNEGGTNKSLIPPYIWKEASRIRFRWAPVSFEDTFQKLNDGSKKASHDSASLRILKEALNPDNFEILNNKQVAAEDLMLAARLKGGLTKERIEAASEFLGKGAIKKTLRKLSREGLLMKSSAGHTATKRGWLLGNHLFGELWNLAGDTEVFHF